MRQFPAWDYRIQPGNGVILVFVGRTAIAARFATAPAWRQDDLPRLMEMQHQQIARWAESGSIT